MTVIQGGRWEGWARRLFSQKGPSEPQSVSPEIILTASVIPPRSEDRILRGDRMYWGRTTSTTAVGNFGFINLRNDSTDQLVILESIVIMNLLATGLIQFRMGNNIVGTGGITVSGRDTRLGLTLTGSKQAGVIRYGHGAAISGTYVANRVAPTNENTIFDTPVVLAPGDGIWVYRGDANITLSATFAWYERAAEPGELNVV